MIGGQDLEKAESSPEVINESKPTSKILCMVAKSCTTKRMVESLPSGYD